MKRCSWLLFWFIAASISAPGQARIQSLSPAQGPIDGGTVVTLTGSGFTGTRLTLDGTALTPVAVSDTQITFQTPAHDNGIASVQLSGNGPNAYAEFLYLPPPLESLPPGYITTVMGIGVFRGDGRQATKASVDSGGGGGLVFGADGTMYFSEPNQSTIRQIRPDGVIERYAGTGMWTGVAADGGPAIAAQLGHPRGLAMNAEGDIFVADQFLNSIRKIDHKTGIITTIAGESVAGVSGDGGPANRAQLNYPIKIAFGGSGDLYILEGGDFFVCSHPRIRKIDANGIITTIAGTGAVGSSGDGGPALVATFDLGTADMGGLAADAAGNVYVADTQNNRVRKIDARTAIISTFLADIGPVVSVATDSAANVYVGTQDIAKKSARILKLTASGQLLQSWGMGYGFSNDGATAAAAPLCNIEGIALDLAGNIVFPEFCASRIRRINLSNGLLETVAGIGPQVIGGDGPAVATMLNDPGTDLLFLPNGDLLTAEAGNYLMRKVDRQGNVSNFAGSGLLLFFNYTRDGVPALQAPLSPVALARAPNGDILVAFDTGISRVDGSGIIHAVIDTGGRGLTGDGGPAGLALLDQPWDVATDSAGNIYIADSDNNRIRRIDARTGVITTVAGSGPGNGPEGYGGGSYCGDGGQATQACLNTPYGIAVAPDGTMYIGENGSSRDQRIRKVDPNGIITTFFSGAGQRLRLGPGGNLFMAPYRIEPNGHAFQFGFNNPSGTGLGDGGPAIQARFNDAIQDVGIAIDQEGNLFFADVINRRIRAIRYGAVITEPGSTVTATAGTPQTTAAGKVFPTAFQITVTSTAGTPENGIRVDFAAPASGPSCTFSSGTFTFSALTDINGHATAVCMANSQVGPYTMTATPLALGRSATFSLANTAPPPKIGSNGIVNGASFDTTKADVIAPGGLISVFGTGLASQLGVQLATTLPLPTQLGGTQVLVNGAPAPVFAVIGNPTFDQVNAQVPFEVAGATKGSLLVRVAGQPDSEPEPVTIAPASPAIFTVSADGQGPAVIQHSSDFTPVNSTSPAKPGEAVVIYCTGLGVTNPPAADGGHGSAAEPFNRSAEMPVLTIGGKAAQVLFSGLTPCCAALYQINAIVPPDAPAGNQPVVIMIPVSNVASRSGVTMSIQP